MSATIYKHEFRTHLRSVINWSVALILIILIYAYFFATFSEQAAVLNDALKNFPPQLRAAFGLDKVDMSTVLGYFSFIFMFVQLCIAIQASYYGFGLVSIEEAELTADFLLSKPVSRTQVLTSKLLAAISSLLITDLVVWVTSYISIAIFSAGHEYDARTFILLQLSILIFQLFFLGVGLVISLLVRRVRSVTPYALGLGFGAYVLNAFSGMLGDVKLELITPFKHFDTAYIVKTGGYDTPLVLLNVAVILVAVAASYWLYIRRDIPSVS